MTSHSPRSQHDRTRRKDRHLNFYELRDNLVVVVTVVVEPCVGTGAY